MSSVQRLNHFRAWDNKRKMFIVEKEIDKRIDVTRKGINSKREGMFTLDKGTKSKDIFYQWFTGKHDKHGYEILTNDIVKYPTGLALIVFDAFNGAFMKVWLEDTKERKLGTMDFMGTTTEKNTEVITTAFEKPEYLEKLEKVR